ncbi:MAG: hypothetical protein IJI34_09245 [Clostridia bacterium]|nr:hypothetical protein [Clostridia bacterium]
MTFAREPSPKRLVPMCALLALLLLCAAEATGLFGLLFLFPLALCMLPLCEERLWGYLLLCDAAVAAFVLAMPFPHFYWLAYVCVLAPFVPLRHAFRNLKKQTHATLLAVGIVLLWTALVLFGLSLLGVNALTLFSPLVTALIGLGLLLFVFLLDAFYQLFLKWYRARLRRFLLPRA